MPLEMTADIFKKQLCLILSENLDNSQYTGTTALVVCLNMYSRIHPASVGWISQYIHWCKQGDNPYTKQVSPY